MIDRQKNLSDSQEREQSAASALRFAREKLGPTAEALLSDPAQQVAVLSRLRDGFDLEDSVLAVVHAAACESRQLADEFLAFFLSDLLRAGHRLSTARVRRFLDTGDLVQSVAGDLWPDLQSIRFETRGRFLSYLSRRLRWKASSRDQQMRAEKRREDKRLPVDPVELDPEKENVSPLSVLVRQEEVDQLALLVIRLPARDRQIVRLYLMGCTHTQIGEELGISKHATRMALQRAIRKLRRGS